MEKQILPQVNKRYLFVYVLFLLLGALNFGYFTAFFVSGFFVDQMLLTFLTFGTELLGSVISGVFPSMGKWKKLLIGNVIVLLPSVTAIMVNEFEQKYLCGVFTGFGIGILSVVVPFYLREIAPTEFKRTVLISFGIAFFAGYQICTVMCFIIYDRSHEKYLGMAYIPTVVLSSAQLLLQLIVFRYDTPKWMAENSLDEKALLQLQKLYPSIDRRLKEFTKLQKLTAEYKSQYPTYKELLTGNNLIQILKGGLLTAACTAIEDLIFYEYGVATNDLPFFLAGFALVTFLLNTGTYFLLDKLSIRKAIVIAEIPVILIAISFIIMDFIVLSKIIPDYDMAEFILIGIEWGLNGLLITPFAFMYAINLMPERGFTLIMIFRWFTLIAMMSPYLIDLKNKESTAYTIAIDIYVIVFSFAALIFAFKAKKSAELDDGGQTIEEPIVQPRLL